MEKYMHTLTLQDFAQSFGTTIEDIPIECRTLISDGNFRYRIPTLVERDAIILGVLKKIETGDFSVAGKEKQDKWKDGWQDILERFVKSNYDVEALAPHYDFQPASYMRLNQDYVIPEDPLFEMKWRHIFRIWFFQKYFSEVDTIYEFGCGSGQNLVELAQLFPQKKLYGLEWVQAPLDIIKLLSEKCGYNVHGKLFDIFSPDQSIVFQAKSAVLTRASLEQIGSQFDAFLSFLLEKSPALCVHSEPLVELYDERNLSDYLAIKFQKKRNYLDGYLNRLRQLEKDGKIEIIKIHRIPLGSLYLDAYSYVVWKPKIKI